MSKPINAKSQALLDEIIAAGIEGVRLEWIGRPDITGTVSHITEKSVWFTDGQFETKRGLFHYRIVK